MDKRTLQQWAENIQNTINHVGDIVWRFMIRISSFLRKEIIEVWRQPRLVLTLILGPFLILLLFGLGFSSQGRTLTALFVVPENSDLRQYVEDYATSLGPQLAYGGITDSEVVARTRLRSGQVDIIVLTPTDASEKIRNNEQAIFRIFHNEINPIQDNYIRFVGRIYVEEVNRRVLQTITLEGQEEAATYETEVESLHQDTTQLRQALEGGEAAEVQQQLRNLERDISILELALGASAQLFGTVQTFTGTDPNQEFSEAVDALADIRRNVGELNEAENSESLLGNDQALDRISEIENDLQLLESRLDEFQRMNPGVLVSPFGSETRTIRNIDLTFADYYTPAVIILLLQHISLTFAGLSIVRERRMGTVELFQVSPLSSAEILIGKYLSFIIFAAILTAILTPLILFVLGVPMLGLWLNYAVAIFLIVFTSVGIGFLISLLSNTTSQAVQYAMIILLASVFFTGFLQDIELLRPPARYISWIMPATYGIRLLQNIMLRGRLFNLDAFLTLGGIGIVLVFVNWFLLRRAMIEG